jgi:3-amino-4-hydroxybenzoic acid synthase
MPQTRVTTRKLCWLDVRDTRAELAPILEEAIHQRVDGIVADRPADWADLPPTVNRILIADAGTPEESFAGVDVVVRSGPRPLTAAQRSAAGAATVGRYVVVRDAASLEDACQAARTEPFAVLEFLDPTKIPLEIVIAAAAGSDGHIITVARDLDEARVISGVLEHGSGFLLPAVEVGDATGLRRAAEPADGSIELVPLVVTGTEHIGMGERSCVDTCSYLGQDEGILVGSYSKGMVLCVSETHPLPYMPTRPFRVNAGAIHSYVLAEGGRTHYLSELRSGSSVLAVDISGRTRAVRVGRVKIESRPLISVDAVAADGTAVNLILQDDWHVRVLGPGGTVLNCTELSPGDVVLGHLPTTDRHVGYPIDEFCLEQ